MYMKRRGEDESSAMSTSARHASRQAGEPYCSPVDLDRIAAGNFDFRMDDKMILQGLE